MITLVSHNIFASEAAALKKAALYHSVYIGEIESDNKFFVWNAKSYPLYRLLGRTYIPLVYFKDMGADITEKDGHLFVYLRNAPQKDEQSRTFFKEKHAYIHSHALYIGNLRTYAIEVESKLLIPIETLRIFFNVTEYKSIYIAENKFYNVNDFIDLDEEWIKNTSTHMIRANIMDVFWDGKKYVDRYLSDILLEPYQKVDKSYSSSDKKLIYITTIVLSINGIKVESDEALCYGQKNELIFKKYSNELKRERLNKLFPAYKVMGIIKSDIGVFKKGEKVEIWRAEKRQYYVVQTKSGKKMMLPCASVAIEGNKSVYNQQAQSEDIEDYIALKGVKSKTDYIIWTDICRQRIYILKKSQNDWKLQKVFVCSSGRNTHLTPSGLFEVKYTFPYFGQNKNFRCKNAVVFFRDYMFHSILFDSTGKHVKEGKYQLGQRVSHGCVRLSEEDSAWIYHHIPVGTTVWIE
jgi:hypothetical protein